MPELPEVETIRQQILPLLPLTIEEIGQSQHLSSLLKAQEFWPQGNILIDIERKGKILDFVFVDHLQNKQHLLCHLGMSGGWRISAGPLSERHLHWWWRCRNIYLSYIDPRRFGRLYLVGEK
ncbi:MAG: DNA-formamidopyrimidine glycosylase family protein, partial [Pseudomonadota bacterium]